MGILLCMQQHMQKGKTVFLCTNMLCSSIVKSPHMPPTGGWGLTLIGALRIAFHTIARLELFITMHMHNVHKQIIILCHTKQNKKTDTMSFQRAIFSQVYQKLKTGLAGAACALSTEQSHSCHSVLTHCL